MRGKQHSEETKAQAMAALLSGQGITEIAKAYELNESTVRN
jgi:transposase-like protein